MDKVTNQLLMEDVLNLVTKLKEKGYTLRQIKKMPIYLGRDDELNGIHTGWYAQFIDKNNKDDKYFFELIGEDYGNVPAKAHAILFS